MDEALIVTLVKARLGISSTVRDAYLSAIVKGVIKELEDEKGILLEATNANHQMFIVDYATWKYESKGAVAMPRYLIYAMNNLIVHNRRRT